MLYLKEYFTLVDFYSFFYRGSLVKFTNKLSHNNEITGILFSLIRSYTYIIKNYKNIIFCFDKNTSISFKKRQYSQYKENRKNKYKEYITKNIYKYKDILIEILPFYFSYNSSYEGDDVIASLSYNLLNKFNLPIIILTLDNDILQLSDFTKIKINDLRHKYKEITISDFKKRFNNLISPKLIPIYKVIFGDKSDNIQPSIKKNIRKNKIIKEINTIYKNKFINTINISNNESYIEFLKIIYNNNKEIFINSFNELLTKLNIILLNVNIETNIYYNECNKSKYEHYCKKYNYKNVEKYDKIINYFNKNTKLLKSISLQNHKIDNFI